MWLVKAILGGLLTIAALVGVAWVGFLSEARPFEIPSQKGNDLGTSPLPEDLLAPIQHYAEMTFNDHRVPNIESAIIIGRAELTLGGITFPARFKFYVDAGEAYYHYIQLTWFGRPILTVDERYKDGIATMNLPGNYIENDANTNAAAHLALWGEASWLPSVLFTDERVQWQAVDDHTAHMIVPDAPEEEWFTVHFDPETGQMSAMSTMRYRDPGDAPRLQWTNHVLQWGTINGITIPVETSTQWEDDEPWAVWHIEDIVLNVDVSRRMDQFGGAYED